MHTNIIFLEWRFLEWIASHSKYSLPLCASPNRDAKKKNAKISFCYFLKYELNFELYKELRKYNCHQLPSWNPGYSTCEGNARDEDNYVIER